MVTVLKTALFPLFIEATRCLRWMKYSNSRLWVSLDVLCIILLTYLVSLESFRFLKFPSFLLEDVAARHVVSPRCCSRYICALNITVWLVTVCSFQNLWELSGPFPQVEQQQSVAYLHIKQTEGNMYLEFLAAQTMQSSIHRLCRSVLVSTNSWGKMWLFSCYLLH